MKAGYELRRVLATHDRDDKTTPAIPMTFAVNPHGDYIGNARDAYFLCVKRGIAPILRTPDSNVCSIGYCSRDGKWYGWSHRAIYGFKPGDELRMGDSGAEGPLPLGFKAIDLEDAKRMAENFAESVS